MHYFRLFLFLGIVFVLTGCTAPQRSSVSLRQKVFFPTRIDSILTAPQLKQTTVAVKVFSIDKNEVLYERNSSLLLHPASTLKLFTAAAALVALGDTFRCETVVYVDSSEKNSSTVSRVYLKGFGDPLLLPQDIDSIAYQLASSGITKISDATIVDNSFFDSLYWGNGWMWDDLGDPDAPSISALSVNHNTLQLIIIPSITPFTPAVISAVPPNSLYSCYNRTLCLPSANGVSSLSLTWSSVDKSPTYVVEGNLTTDSPVLTRTIAVPSPELFAGELLRRSLALYNIEVSPIVKRGYVPPSAFPVARHTTPLDSILVAILKNSDNLAAENILKILGATTVEQPGSAKKGLTYLSQYLSSLGIDTSSIRIVDGSGVSRYNLLSADVLVDFLTAVRRSNIGEKFITLLPQGGNEGTLKNRSLLSQCTVRAKTGTLNGVSTLAGYAETTEGELLAFAIMMQHFIDAPAQYRAIQDSIIFEVSKFKRSY